MSNDHRRHDASEFNEDDNPFLGYDSSWDFVDPDEFLEKLNRTMDSLAPDDPDPDYTMPEEFRSIWLAALEDMEEEDRKFSSGNIILNMRQYIRFCTALQFLKELQSRGIGTVTKADFKKSKSPSEIEFESEAFLLHGVDKDRFAEVIEGCCFDASVTSRDTIVLNLSFSDMWLPIPDGDI